jgi:hypothetical protein
MGLEPKKMKMKLRFKIDTDTEKTFSLTHHTAKEKEPETSYKTLQNLNPKSLFLSSSIIIITFNHVFYAGTFSLSLYLPLSLSLYFPNFNLTNSFLKMRLWKTATTDHTIERRYRYIAR